MLKAQAAAAADLMKYEEAIAKFKAALAVKGISAEEKEECEKKLKQIQKWRSK